MKIHKSGYIIFLSLYIVFVSFCYGQSSGSDLMTFTNSAGHQLPVKTLFEWQVKREQILDSMQALFGQFPGDPVLPPFDPRIPALLPFNTIIVDSMETDIYTRYNIRFTVAENEDVTAYLYIPIEKERSKRFPAMLALHQTESIGKKSVDGQGPYINLAYAKELAQRGYIVIAPDYPSFGDQENYNFAADRYESGVMKAIFNHIRCVDFLQSRADVDPERIGVIGHSLGGHSAMYVAAFDARIKVIVSSCGWTLRRYYNNYNEQMRKKYGSRLWGMTQQRYTPLAHTKYQLKVELMPFDFDELIAVLAPRPFFSNSPVHDANFNVEGVRVGMANASAVYHFLHAYDHLQVRYPVSSHDFPPEVRYESYNFIDKYLKK